MKHITKQENPKVSLMELFLIFAKIGAFTIGGGYAMIPLIEDDIVVRKKYLSPDDFIDVLAVAQSSPGILAANIAIFVGYKIRGFKGSIFSTLGAVLPSFIIILIIAIFFSSFKDNPNVVKVFKGLRPGVVALIAVPTFNMARRVNLAWTNFWIPIVSALLIWWFGVSPIYIILIAGFGGIFVGYIERRYTK